MDASVQAIISFNTMEYFNISSPYAKTIALYSWSGSVNQFVMGSTDNAGNRARSWNYTVGDIATYVPDGEVTWQGDSYNAYVKAVALKHALTRDLILKLLGTEWTIY